MGVKLARLEADDFAPCAGTFEQQRGIGFSSEIRDAKQSHSGEQLRYESETENLRTIGEEPLDLLFGKRH